MSTTTSVNHLVDEQRYEFRDGEARAVLEYERDGAQIVFTHTFVPPEFRGQGIAEKLVRTALADARQHALSVVPQCSYVAKFIERHVEFQDLLAKDR